MIEFKVKILSKDHAIQILSIKGRKLIRHWHRNTDDYRMRTNQKHFVDWIREEGIECESWQLEAIGNLEYDSAAVIYRLKIY